MCIELVRKFIFDIPKDQIFATREVLSCGSRAAVDQSLSRLVNLGLIIRLARGIFVRDPDRSPTIQEVAAAKARAFNKLFARHSAALAFEMGIVNTGNLKSTFSIVGRSSSFRAGGTVIYFRGVCARKLVFGDSKAGHAIRALWHLGKKNCGRSKISQATSTFGRTDRQEFRSYIRWMPTWMSKFFTLS